MAHGTEGRSIRFHRWQVIALDLVVRRTSDTRSEIVRRAVTEYLDANHREEMREGQAEARRRVGTRQG